jgi:hypothetical protein
MVKRLSLALIASIALLAGCGGGGGSTAANPELFFINASTDSGAVDFRFDDVARITGLNYTGSSTAFSEIEFKGEDVEGWDVSLHLGTGDEIERQAIVFGQASDNVVLAHGIRNFAAGDILKKLRFSTFTVDRKRPNGNKAKLIVVHAFELAAGNNTPAVVFKTPGDNALFTTGSIEPGRTNVITTDSGSLTFEARRANTQGIYDTVTQNLAPGAVYIVLISGVENDPVLANQIKIRFIEIPSTN